MFVKITDDQGRPIGQGNRLAADIGTSIAKGANDEDVANFAPSTTHGYDPGTGSLRMMSFARRTWEQQFFKAIPVPPGNTTIVTTAENLSVADFSKIRLFAKTAGAGNIDLVLRISVNGGYDYENAHTFSMGDAAKTVMSPVIELGATHIKVGLFNKSATAQNVDVWGFVFS